MRLFIVLLILLALGAIAMLYMDAFSDKIVKSIKSPSTPSSTADRNNRRSSDDFIPATYPNGSPYAGIPRMNKPTTNIDRTHRRYYAGRVAAYKFELEMATHQQKLYTAVHRLKLKYGTNSGLRFPIRLTNNETRMLKQFRAGEMSIHDRQHFMKLIRERVDSLHDECAAFKLSVMEFAESND